LPDQIQANYDELQQVSSQFNNCSQAIEALQQKIRGSYAKLADKGWIGKGAEAFFDEMESKIFPTQQRLQQALEKAGQTTGQIAQNVKQAEEEASSLFKH
jgi:WXG100 family type VII secretion target